MSSDEGECVTRPLREREVVGDGIHLVDELVRFEGLEKNNFARGESEVLHGGAATLEQFEVLGACWARAYSVSVCGIQRRLFISLAFFMNPVPMDGSPTIHSQFGK